MPTLSEVIRKNEQQQIEDWNVVFERLAIKADLRESFRYPKVMCAISLYQEVKRHAEVHDVFKDLRDLPDEQQALVKHQIVVALCDMVGNINKDWNYYDE